jgi:hypothetical protein
MTKNNAQQDILVWYQRRTDAIRDVQANLAYGQILNTVIPAMRIQCIPHQFVYDEVNDTTNLVLPASIAANVLDLLTDAGFIEKDMPTKDVEASRDMLTAMFNGANLQKAWS